MNRDEKSLSERADGIGAGRVFVQPDARIHKMLAHPVRFKIVWRLGDGPATAVQLADWLEEDRQYITRLLAELRVEGLVEVVKEEPNPKGGKTYTYRATDRYLWNADEWARLPKIERKQGSLGICQTINEEIGRALQSESFDEHPHRVLIRRPVWCDDVAAAEIDEIFTRADAEAAAAARRSAERNHSGKPPRRWLLDLLAYLASPQDH